jgi:hypothetical protein
MRFERAIALIDAANAEDPRQDVGPGGERQARELVYSRRMAEMLERYAPQAPEAVRLAVRAQHIQRWKIPRESYPEGRSGYLQWRARLYDFHADTASRLMREAGYDERTIEQVAGAVGKKRLKANPDAQAVEDVSALVFLEHYLLDFVAGKPHYGEEKWLDILAKTSRKMSAGARAFALSGKLALPEALAPLVRRAIGLP